MRGFQGFIFFWPLLPTSVDPAACWIPKALFALLSIHRPLPPEEWKRLYEREHARAEAAEARIAELEDKLGEAEARAEEWRQESVSARCDLNVLRSVFASNKEKLAAARADLKELHRSRSTENVRRLEKEAARLQGLLNAAGIECGRHSMTGMRKEMSRLKDVIARQAEELKELKAENERLRSARETHAKARHADNRIMPRLRPGALNPRTFFQELSA